MNQQNKSSSWIEHLIGPAVVGIVVLLGQLLIQPLIQSKAERWNAKRTAYLAALKVVNQKYDSMPWYGPDAPSRSVPLQEPPPSAEVNNSYTELMLYSDNNDLITKYLDCFGVRNTNEPIHMATRNELINLMRRDLGFRAVDIRPENVKFIKIP